MGSIGIKIALVVLVLFGFLIFQGCREVSVSMGASSEPVYIELSDVKRGGEFEDRHVELGGYYPLVDSSYENGSNVYVPLAPVPESGEIPTEPYLLKAAARNARVIAHITGGSDEDNVVKQLQSGTGLVMGTVDNTFSSELRNVLEGDLGSDAGDIRVVQLGKKPSLILGISMIIGGIAGALVSCVVGLVMFSSD